MGAKYYERELISLSIPPTTRPYIAFENKPPETRSIRPIQALVTTKRPSTKFEENVSRSPTLKPTTIQHNGNKLSGSLNLVIFLAGILGVVMIIQVIYVLCKIGISKSSRAFRDNVNISIHPRAELISKESTDSVDHSESSVLNRAFV